MMDTPMPDGRLMVRPQDFIGGTLSAPAGVPQVTATGVATVLAAGVPGALLRFGMSDDAQQQYGRATPMGGYQGAQGQVVTTPSPFTSPYGPSGRPPFPSSSMFKTLTGRPKGLRPKAVTTVYSVTGGPLTALQVGLYKTVFQNTVAPSNVAILAPSNLSLGNFVTNTITVPIPDANRAFLTDLNGLNVAINVTGGAGTFILFGVFIECDFNYN